MMNMIRIGPQLLCDIKLSVNALDNKIGDGRGEKANDVAIATPRCLRLLTSDIDFALSCLK